MMKNPPLIAHDVGKGIVRLLSAARDFPGRVVGSEPETPAHAEEPYRQLFTRYVGELQWAVELAVPWWNALIARRVDRGESERASVRANYELRPAGPASRPEVVWVVRTFWLECDRLNRASPLDRRVPPEMLLLRWLDTTQHAPLLAVVSGMPYWPIGLDPDGVYC